MNILLVCGNGITTTMLSARLQKYAQEQGKQDYFSAARVGQYREMLPHADLVLIAPQAALMADALREEAEQEGIPCQQLTEEVFVLGQVEKIYAYIDSIRVQSVPKPEPVRLTLPILGQTLLNAGLYSVPILIFGLLCRGLGMLFSAAVLTEAGQATFSLLILYFMFSVGYQYGALTHREPVGRGMIALGAPLLMLPLGNLVESWNAAFRVAVGQIPLAFFALPNALFLATLSVLAVGAVYQLDKIRFPASITTLPMMENMLKMGAVSALFILLRVVLSSL